MERCQIQDITYVSHLLFVETMQLLLRLLCRCLLLPFSFSILICLFLSIKNLTASMKLAFSQSLAYVLGQKQAARGIKSKQAGAHGAVAILDTAFLSTCTKT